MKVPIDPLAAEVAETIGRRVRPGSDPNVAGWQNTLAGLLRQLERYLRPGRLVTFFDLASRERPFFEDLHRQVTVPASACAVYISPSIRHRMLYQRPTGTQSPTLATGYDPLNPPDNGVLLASRRQDYATIVNALFAKPPHAPAIDVYDDGRLLAGYVYYGIAECIGQVERVLRTHLGPPPPP